MDIDNSTLYTADGEDIVSSDYSELLAHIPNDTMLIDLCGILHSAETEIVVKLDKAKISREIRLTGNNVIVKIWIKTPAIMSSSYFFMNLKTRLAIALRRLNGGVGLYDQEEDSFQYYIVIPFN